MFKFFISTVVILFTAFIDLFSKYYISKIAFSLPLEVTSFLNIVLTYNHGVSFGMLSSFLGDSPLILVFIALILSFVLLFFLYKSDTKIQIFAFSLMIGGAIGNIIDRYINDAVTDFIDIHAYGFHWPAFNIADSALCIGVAIILIDSILIND